MPTRRMFSCITSARGLLIVDGHAAPSTRSSTVVPVIIAAACAIV